MGAADDPAPKPSEKPVQENWMAGFHEAGPYLGLGLQFAMTMAFFTVGGYLLDRWLETLPLLTVVGAVVGMVALFFLLFRVTRELSAKSKTKKKKSPDDEP